MKPRLIHMQEKQRIQQEQVYELSEHVADLEERQRSLNRALESYRQVSIAMCFQSAVHLLDATRHMTMQEG